MDSLNWFMEMNLSHKAGWKAINSSFNVLVLWIVRHEMAMKLI